MKNQIDYFEKVIKLLRDLKKDHQDIEISKHYLLATSESNFLSDKELYHALQKHKNELDINTLSNTDMDKLISDTDDIFRDVAPYDEEDDYDEEEF